MHNHLLSGSSINGTIVQNRNGDSIGNIKDVMIDTRFGEISYAVLEVDSGFLNLGSKYFAVPLQAFEFDFEHKRVLMDITRERLENAPGFDKEDWPSGPQSDFIGSVYDFYEVPLTDRYSAEMPSNRNSLSGNAATRQTSGGFKSEGSDQQEETSYDHSIKGSYNKSIH
ncbi:PRC-barrel domain containing protein [Cryomorpha ignava]|uniref:PRC-barrel domain containing protein n=1 Tax=Cryomorpha ignava TaxID=101383 RepID=A0A7K3WU15_9FLAO|nr:PRC-barrel domain containing protein [Cryomorpha ignava]